MAIITNHPLYILSCDCTVTAVVSVMAKMSVNCVLVVISLLVSWFTTSLYVEGKYLNNKQL